MQRIRDDVADRLAAEHDWSVGTSDDGRHLIGSARVGAGADSAQPVDRTTAAQEGPSQGSTGGNEAGRLYRILSGTGAGRALISDGTNWIDLITTISSNLTMTGDLALTGDTTLTGDLTVTGDIFPTGSNNNIIRDIQIATAADKPIATGTMTTHTFNFTGRSTTSTVIVIAYALLHVEASDVVVNCTTELQLNTVQVAGTVHTADASGQLSSGRNKSAPILHLAKITGITAGSGQAIAHVCTATGVTAGAATTFDNMRMLLIDVGTD